MFNVKFKKDGDIEYTFINMGVYKKLMYDDLDFVKCLGNEGIIKELYNRTNFFITEDEYHNDKYRQLKSRKDAHIYINSTEKAYNAIIKFSDENIANLFELPISEVEGTILNAILFLLSYLDKSNDYEYLSTHDILDSIFMSLFVIYTKATNLEFEDKYNLWEKLKVMRAKGLNILDLVKPVLLLKVICTNNET